MTLGASPSTRWNGSAIRTSARTRSSARSRRQGSSSSRSRERSPRACRVLVLDEPTSSLAYDDVRRLFDLVARLKAQGLAIVYISHFIEEVKLVSDRFVVLRDGRYAGGGDTAAVDGDAIVSLMVGRALEDLYPRHRQASGEPVLEVENLDAGRGVVHPASR